MLLVLITLAVEVLVSVVAEQYVRENCVLCERSRREAVRETVASHWPDERVKVPRNGASWKE